MSTPGVARSLCSPFSSSPLMIATTPLNPRARSWTARSVPRRWDLYLRSMRWSSSATSASRPFGVGARLVGSRRPRAKSTKASCSSAVAPTQALDVAPSFPKVSEYL